MGIGRLWRIIGNENFMRLKNTLKISNEYE